MAGPADFSISRIGLEYGRMSHRSPIMRLSRTLAKLGMAAVLAAAMAVVVTVSARHAQAAASRNAAVTAPAAQAQAIVTAAEKWVTNPVTPYCWGGGNDDGPTHGDGEAAGHYSGPKGKSGCYGASVKGFDCSGLVKYAIYQALGISLYHSAQDQSEGITDAGPNVHPKIIKMANLEPGDIVVFGESKTDIGHDGIYVGDGQIVNAYDYKNDGDNGTDNEYWGVMKMSLSWVQGGFPFAEGVRYWSATTSTPAPTPSPTTTAAPSPSPSSPGGGAPAGADDWAQAGHDPAQNYDNAGEQTIGTGNADKLVRSWSAGRGLVVEQPLVYQGHVYRITGDVLSASRLTTGKVLWRKSLGSGGQESLYAAGDGEVLYGEAAGTDKLVAVSASTGGQLWSVPDNEFAGAQGEVLIDGQYVVDGVLNVQVLDASTGKLRWQALDGAGDGGPSAFAVSDGRVIRQAMISGKLYLESRKLSSGAVQWTTAAPCGASDRANNTNLAIGGSVIYFHDSCSKTVRAYQLSTGKQDWKATDTGGQGMVGMATNGSDAYAIGTSGKQAAVRAYADGKVRWHAQLGIGAAARTTPTLAGGVLFVTVENPVSGSSPAETTMAFSASAGTLLWTSSPLAETEDTPFVADGHLLVGSQVYRLS
jgi:cell wall-associated NlpC family hydrolase